MSKSPRHILTFDVEDWYHPTLVRAALKGRDDVPEDRLEKPLRLILELLKQTENRATFFVLGELAERFPDLVKQVGEAGHEIASHGYRHEMVTEYDEEMFRADVGKSLEVLEAVSGKKVIGYRAPSWSLSRNVDWHWKVLKEAGLRYDSSIFPMKTFLFGDDSAPLHIHRLPNGLVEVPPSALKFWGRRLPFAGGFFLRAAPLWLINKGIRKCAQAGRPAVLYLHPWELDPGLPRVLTGRRDRLATYYNLEGTERKLRYLLSQYKFDSIGNFLENRPAGGNA